MRGLGIDDRPDCFPPYTCPTWGLPVDGTTSTAPVLSSDQQVAYVATDAGTVYAVDTETHAVIWSLAFGTAVTATPALAGGTLFVPMATGNLLALDADTGALKWAGLVDSRVTVQPAVAGGVVFTGAANGTVAAFNAAGCGSGFCTRLWSISTGSPISGAPAVSAGRLYVGTQDGRVLAFAR